MLKEIVYDFGGYNEAIFHFLNHIGNIGVLPYVLRTLSGFFRIWSFSIYYIMFCAYQYYRINTLSKDIRERAYRDIYYKLVQVGICYAFFGFTYAMLKFSINLPRPYCSLPEGSFITMINTDHVRCLSSFPSAHVGLALMMTICAWPYIGKIWRVIAICTVAAVAFARIILAMHYPADILYSIIITFLSVGVSQLIFAIFRDNLIKYFCEVIKPYAIRS